MRNFWEAEMSGYKFMNESLNINERVRALLRELTLDEKLLQTLIILNELGSGQGSDGFFVQLSLIALDDFFFNFVLLCIGLL